MKYKKYILILIESIYFFFGIFVFDFYEISMVSVIGYIKIISSFIIARAIEAFVIKCFNYENFPPQYKWLRIPVCMTSIGAVLYVYMSIFNLMVFGKTAAFLNDITISTCFWLMLDHIVISYIVDVWLGIRKSPLAWLDRKLGFDKYDEDDL